MPEPRVPVDAARVLDELAGVVRSGAGGIALYAAGSLASGDYRPGVSDLDLVTVVPAPLGRDRLRLLAIQHRRLAAEHLAAAKLHCAYVSEEGIGELGARHATWAHGRFLQRPLSAIGRAELLTHGVVVFGPAPADLFPAVAADDVAAAARAELTGVWRPATHRPWLWWQDLYVDLGLTTLVRAAATLADGTLLTKSAAIERLPEVGAPAALVDEVARRRRGEPVVLNPGQRGRRAVLVRRLVAAGIDRVLSATPPAAGAAPARPS